MLTKAQRKRRRRNFVISLLAYQNWRTRQGLKELQKQEMARLWQEYVGQMEEDWYQDILQYQKSLELLSVQPVTDGRDYSKYTCREWCLCISCIQTCKYYCIGNCRIDPNCRCPQV